MKEPSTDAEPLLGTRVSDRDDKADPASFRARALKAGFSEEEVDALISIYGKAQEGDDDEYR
jgi:hypothetical protein